MIDLALREGSHFFEWTHKRLGGEEFPATVLLTRLEIGNHVFLQATVRDVSRQKHMEMELKPDWNFMVSGRFSFAPRRSSGRMRCGWARSRLWQIME